MTPTVINAVTFEKMTDFVRRGLHSMGFSGAQESRPADSTCMEPADESAGPPASDGI